MHKNRYKLYKSRTVSTDLKVKDILEHMTSLEGIVILDVNTGEELYDGCSGNIYYYPDLLEMRIRGIANGCDSYHKDYRRLGTIPPKGGNEAYDYEEGGAIRFRQFTELYVENFLLNTEDIETIF